MNKTIKNSMFKIKKVISKNATYEGVIIPSWNERHLKFSKQYITLYTLDGKVLEFNIEEVTIKSTKITDKKVKNKLDKVIAELKEEHQIKLEQVKLNTDFLAKLEKLKNKCSDKQEDIEENIEDLLKAQGLTTNKFKRKMLDLAKVPYNFISKDVKSKTKSKKKANLFKKSVIGFFIWNMIVTICLKMIQ